MPDRTTSRIVIGAPRPRVMSVIADFARYPEWATGIRSAEVVSAGADGRAAAVRFSLDAGVIRDSYLLSYSWEDDTRVSWDLAEPATVISEMSGAYLLADRPDGTEVSYQLAVGLRVPMPGLFRRRAEKTIIDTALRGLKARAEAGDDDG
jgi:uncharacterized membrane protein